MKSVTMTLLLICTVLALSVVGQGQEKPGIKKKALALVRENLHSKNTTKHAYRKIGRTNITKRDGNSNTFVKIEAKLQQTNCKKEDREKGKCPSIEHCTGCFIFKKNSDVVVSQYIDCCPETSLSTDQENMRRKSCNNMKRKYLPTSLTVLSFHPGHVRERRP
ncbi:retinoic acid receptor responder protein 2 [Bombina bombina]|uniref:retinoic acid receptor responder protein 2 n=1 Tax=Bombina bombina TaxID=8345 RepID=UPI00235AB1FC|nr:retinoic acid receptor responder protein 2 [Bombina bombina]